MSSPMPNPQPLTTSERAAALKCRWQEYLTEHPNTRIRDVASALNCSEAELVASQCGDSVTRINGPWLQLIGELEVLGKVMSLTRNDHAVHETHGTFAAPSKNHGMGVVIGNNIDLRIRFNRWHFGFAVTETSQRGERYSLQFFDACGDAVMKVYMTDDSDLSAFRNLVTRYRSQDQTAGVEVRPRPATEKDSPDDCVDVANLKLHWQRLRDTHDFNALLRDFDVSRSQAMRLVGEPLAVQISPDAIRSALEHCLQQSIALMIFVSSPGVTQIFAGTIHKLLATGPWFNVLDPDFNLHLRDTELGSAWIVRKPSGEHHIRSLELFDRNGALTALIFENRIGVDAPNPAWEALLDQLIKENRQP